MGYSFENKQTYNDPQEYYWFDNAFTKEELDQIYNGVEQLPFQEATIFGNNSKAIRSSSIKWIPQNDQWKWLYDKLMEYAQIANDELWHFNLVSAPEQIQYTEYYASEDGHYTWHQDIGPGAGALRKVSITVQLSESDEYEGGDLEISRGGFHGEAAPRGAGRVVIFPSYMPHRVTEVTKGTRRSFVLWVGGEHYK